MGGEVGQTGDEDGSYVHKSIQGCQIMDWFAILFSRISNSFYLKLCAVLKEQLNWQMQCNALLKFSWRCEHLKFVLAFLMHLWEGKQWLKAMMVSLIKLQLVVIVSIYSENMSFVLRPWNFGCGVPNILNTKYEILNIVQPSDINMVHRSLSSLVPWRPYLVDIINVLISRLLSLSQHHHFVWKRESLRRLKNISSSSLQRV